MRSYTRDHGSGRGSALRCVMRGCARRPAGGGQVHACRRGACEPDLLPFDEEVELAKRARAGESEAVEQLVRVHLRPLRLLALKFRWYGVPIDDLVQEGVIGLLHSLPQYEPERRVRLMTFSAHAVRLRMFRVIVEDRAVGTATRDSSWGRRFFRADDRARMRLARKRVAPSAPSTTPGSGSFVYMAPSPPAPNVVFDLEFEPGGSGSWTTGTWRDPERELGQQEWTRLQRDQVRAALERLDERERMIVEQRVMADEPSSFRDIARRLGISGERVKQIQVRALEKLRGCLGMLRGDPA